MDKTTVYMILDIVFTPLFETASHIMDLNTSKSCWVKAEIEIKDNELVFPTFAASVFCPFVISESGIILKCVYNPSVVGIQCHSIELDYIKKGIAIDSISNPEWDWSKLCDKRRSYHLINQVYTGFKKFKSFYRHYPQDNSMLRLLIKDAELEL